MTNISFLGALDLVETVGLLGLLALAYGAIRRSAIAPAASNVALGLLFGAVAAVGMLNPIVLAPGVIVDMRNLVVGFAGAFLGPGGMIVALSLTGMTRIALGGAGMAAGLAGMAISGGLGLIWSRIARTRAQVGFGLLLLLSLMISGHALAAILLPSDVIGPFVRGVVPVLVAVNILGTLTLGGLLERERRLSRRVAELDQDARTDPLTGLLNRRGFISGVELTQLGSRVARGVAVLLVDLDHFKRINDALGHEAGDAVLHEVGRRLAENVRGGDLIGRYGGEEFVVFLPNAGEAQAATVGERLREAIAAEPVAWRGREIAVTASVGGHWSADLMQIETAIRQADLCLYRAKRQGRNRTSFCDACEIADPALEAA